MQEQYTDVINFWFKEIPSEKWFMKDIEFDKLIIKKFSKLHYQASICELSNLRNTALGCLAEIILLDQFSRNMYRNHVWAFAYDSLALSLSQNAILRQMDN